MPSELSVQAGNSSGYQTIAFLCPSWKFQELNIGPSEHPAHALSLSYSSSVCKLMLFYHTIEGIRLIYVAAHTLGRKDFTLEVFTSMMQQTVHLKCTLQDFSDAFSGDTSCSLCLIKSTGICHNGLALFKNVRDKKHFPTAHFSTCKQDSRQVTVRSLQLFTKTP